LALFVGVALLVIPAAQAAGGSGSEPSVRAVQIYASPDEVDARPELVREYGMHQLKSIPAVAKGEFTVRALVAPVLEGRVTSVRHDLGLSDSEELSGGWERKGAVVTGGAESAIEKPLELTLAVPARTRIGDADEARIAYERVIGQPPCSPELVLQSVRAGERRAVYGRASGGPWSVPIVNLDGWNFEWAPRTLWYLFQRQFGLPGDDVWRFSRDGDRAVLQRRLDIDLARIDGVDVGLGSSAVVQQVNVRVALKTGGTRILEFPELTRQSSSLSLRLDLKQALASQYPTLVAEASKVTEIVFFLKGDVGNLLPDRPLRRVSFLASQANATSSGVAASVWLPSLHTASAGVERWIVDLRPAATMPGEIAAAKLILESPMGASRCSIRIRSVQLVRPYAQPVPVFARALERSTQRLGIDVLEDAREDRVWAPGIRFHGYFGELRETKTDGRCVSSRGAVAQLPALGTCTHSDDSLILEGEGVARIEWPLQLNADRKMRVEVMAQGGGDSAKGGALKLQLAGGRTVSRTIPWNSPVKLDLDGARIERASLSLPLEADAPVTLREVAFFEPAQIPVAEAFDVPIPGHRTEIPSNPVPAFHSSSLSFRDGAFEGYAAAIPREGLRFATTLPHALEALSKVRIHFSFPQSYASQPCPVTFTLVWEHGTSDRKICVDSPAGYVDIGPEDVQPSAPADLGRLLGLRWTVLAPGMSARADESLSIRAVVRGWAGRSPREAFAAAPLLTSGSVDIAPSANDRRADGAFDPSGPFNTLLDPDAVRRAIELDAKWVPVQGPFKVEEAWLTPANGLNLAQWEKVNELPQQRVQTLPVADLLAASALVIALLWLSISRGALACSMRMRLRRIPASGWAFGRSFLKRSSAFFGTVFDSTILIASLTLGVGFASRFGFTFASIVLLASVLMAAWVAYRRLRRLAPGGDIGVFAACVALAVAASAWALGAGDSPLPAIFPFLVAGYAGLPGAPRSPVYRTIRAWLAEPATYRPLATCVAISGIALLPHFPGGAGDEPVASIAITLASLAILLAAKGPASRRWPFVARRMYRTSAEPVWILVVAALGVTVISVAFNRTRWADLAGVVSYLAMLTAIVESVRAHRKRDVA
jgi:hypothetical protein